jgi:hypothetical protein
MPTQRLSALLAAGKFSPLCDESRRMRELQRVLLDSAPLSLAQASRVTMVRSATLYLSADNVAVAAKLRQITPRLLRAFRERVPEVTGIRVEAQVSERERRLRNDPNKTALGVETIDNFERLAAQVPDAGLRSALETLVRRHRAKRTG